MTDTIFAVSSGSPPAAIAVLRLSGAGALAAARALAGDLPPPRRAAVRALHDPRDGSLLDRALVLVFPGPASATGEDLVELHLHGGRAVVRAAENALAALPGLRPAEAGEFTRRALENGRVDLTEAEGLGDLLAAETEMQRRAALASAEGGLRRRVEDWTARTVGFSAAVEAVIDHGDEEDAADEAALLAPVRSGLKALAGEIGAVLAEPPVERLRDGLRVVFAGPPNSGKSTLFNRMTGRDAAIVSPIAGTTRDRIEAPVERNGIAWLLIDTAGLVDATHDPIEAIGVDRSRDAIAGADVVLWLGDESPPHGAVAIHARADQPGRADVPAGRIAASGVSDGGAQPIWNELDVRAQRLLPRSGMFALNQRQRDLCGAAQECLRSAAEIGDPLLIAEELRHARLAFDRLTGRADTEAVFDALFARFCIGK